MQATDVHSESSAARLRSLREVTDAAAAIFTEPPRAKAAITYLRQRGIDASSLASEWVLGYAPPGWTRLVDRLRADFAEEALLDAGVARRSTRETMIDTFRDRVIFGIRDTDGNVAGFIGRDLSGNPGAPKYLNTCRHELFDKGRLLFGLYEGSAGDESRRRQPVVVEGPIDVLAVAARASDGGHADLLPVAPCGTAFSRAHAEQVATLAFEHRTPVVVAMDNDAPGRAAALTTGEYLSRRGVEVRIATMPDGTDPAEFVASGGGIDVFQAASGLPLINLQVEHAVALQGDRMRWIEGRLAALRSIAPHLAHFPPRDMARQVGWLANVLQLDVGTVTHELAESCVAPKSHQHIVAIG